MKSSQLYNPDNLATVVMSKTKEIAPINNALKTGSETFQTDDVAVQKTTSD